MDWIDCPKCKIKDTCKKYQAMLQDQQKNMDIASVCVKGCK